MEAVSSYSVAFAILFLASTVTANIGELDEHWKTKSQQAKARAQAAYRPDPEAETESFNDEVHRALDRGNNTRRNLKGKKGKGAGACHATNPIDRCWRCKDDWANNRQKLADCAKGFGRRAKGGKGGEIYTVTDASDNDLVNPKPGSLRFGVIQNRPLWIIFAHDMVIRLTEELMVNSNKTIDARGANVHITGGAQITIQYVHNVIVHGLHIHDLKVGNGGMIRDSETHYGFRTKSDGDGISIYGSTDVWIDHVSLSNCMDGLVDVIESSTAVTISNCHFTNHNEVMLFGASDSYSDDQIMQVTVAFNHFGQGLVQRMPRCRWGFVHVVNNDYTHWLMYAIGGSQHPTIISQGNRFTAPPNPQAKEVTKRDYAPENVWSGWTWISQGDLLRNGAFFRQSGSTDVNKYQGMYSRLDMIKFKPAEYVSRLTRFSGALNCKVGNKC